MCPSERRGVRINSEEEDSATATASTSVRGASALTSVHKCCLDLMASVAFCAHIRKVHLS